MYGDDLKKNIGDPTTDDGFAALKQEADEQLASGYMADQSDLVNYISESLVNHPQLAAQNPKRYDELQKYWAFLAFAALPSYKRADQANLLQKRLLYAMQKGYDPDDFLREFYSIYESYDFIKDQFQTYAKDLEANTETFGTQPIDVEGKRVVPQLKNWILDYAKFPQKVARRGTVERLNYTNQSVNTKSLPQGQRQLLMTVLKFYDDLLNAEIPGERAEAEPTLVNQPEIIQRDNQTTEYRVAPQRVAPPTFSQPTPIVQAPAQPQVQATQVQPKPQGDIDSRLENLKQRISK